MIVCFFSAVFLCPSPCSSAKTDAPGQKTYWDQLMEYQTAHSVMRGAELMQQNRYEEAVKEFVKAVLATPKDPEAHRMLGAAYYWTGNVEQAELEFNESLKLDPDSAQTQLLLGIVWAWKGDLEKAYAFFQAAARLDPKRADIQMNIGSIEESIGRYPEALAYFRKAVELDAQSPLYRFQLGMLYGRLGRYDEAVESLKKAIRLYPDYEDALLELGAIYEHMGQTKDAGSAFERCVRLKGRDAVARLRLARIELMLGREEKARDVLRDVFHLTPADAGGGLALSVTYGGKAAGGDSEPSGNPAPGSAAPGGPRGPSGQTPGAAGDGKAPAESQSPLDMLRRNLARLPLDQEAQLQVDVAFLPKPKLVRKAVGEGGSALKKELERAGKPPPGSVTGARREYRLSSSDKRQRLAEIDKIVADVKGVLDSAPADSETRLGMNLSFSEISSGPSRASGGESRVSYQPRDVGNDMGLWVIGTGWMALVEEVLTPAGDRMPREGSAPWWIVEGIGYATMGKARQAADAFVRALELDDKSELGYLGLGVARVISGDEKGAADAYRRALALNPGNRAASEGLKWLLREPVAAEPGQPAAGQAAPGTAATGPAAPGPTVPAQTAPATPAQTAPAAAPADAAPAKTTPGKAAPARKARAKRGVKK